MHKFSAETLELFRIHQWSVIKHLDKMCDADAAEIKRVRDILKNHNEDRKNCQDCKVSLTQEGSFVCLRHYHDYLNQGYECCWTCFVMTVHEEQLGIILE